MKNTDIVAKVLREAGVTDFFAVTGGAAVHIIDSLIQHGDMKAVFHHHEQAAALAADSYARLRNLGVCVVTTGPGVTNALTGLLCSWQDSVPTVFISGQARHSLTGLGADVRQVRLHKVGEKVQCGWIFRSTSKFKIQRKPKNQNRVIKR